MRGVIRRDDRALPLSEALDILREAEHGVLATIDKEGRPCTAALNHVLLDDGCLYFHSGPGGEKIDNIHTNPEVSYFVTGFAEVVFEQFTTAYSSVVVHGTMSELEDEAEKREALAALVERFHDGTVPAPVVESFIEDSLSIVVLLKLTPEHVTGKSRTTRKRPCLIW
jgi:nitroimidazol reductase NimA-like FMN-containing flavoprotein (pyridoxamine 5'-phosphate oxidase superfamily)